MFQNFEQKITFDTRAKAGHAKPRKYGTAKSCIRESGVFTQA